jgi:transposase, IS30 family
VVSWFPCVGELADDEQAASVQAGRVRQRPRHRSAAAGVGYLDPQQAKGEPVPAAVSQAARQAAGPRPEMRLCHETIYQAPYVQGRGELRREIAAALRAGRARRQERQPNPASSCRC